MSWSGPRKIGYPTPPYKKPTGMDAKKIQHMEDKYPGREVWLSKDGKKGYAGKPIDGENIKAVANKKQLTKKGKALKKKAYGKPKKQELITTEQQELREKTLKKKTKDLYIKAYKEIEYKGHKLSEEQFEKFALIAPDSAFEYASKRLSKNKELLKKCALKSPSDALHHGIEYLDEKTLKKVVIEMYAQTPSYRKENEAFFVYYDDLDYSTVRKALFSIWVKKPHSFMSNQFRDNVADIFKLKNISKVSERIIEFPKATKKALTDLHKETQIQLKKEYPSGKVKLYRGIKRKVDAPYAFNSFSSDVTVARKFNGHDIIEVDVPIEKILSYPKSGSITGEMKESEYIVMGNYNEF